MSTGRTVTELGDELTGITDSLHAAARDRGEAARAQDHVERLEAMVARFNRILIGVRELVTAGVSWPDLPALHNLHVPKSLSEPREWLRSTDPVDLREATSAAAVELEQAIQLGWRTALEDLGAVVPDKATLRMLTTTHAGGDLADAVAELQDLMEQFDGLHRQSAPEPGDGDGLRELRARFEAVLDEIGSVGFSEERRDLLQRISSVNGLPLNELTCGELEWLKSFGAAASMHIRRRWD